MVTECCGLISWFCCFCYVFYGMHNHYLQLKINLILKLNSIQWKTIHNHTKSYKNIIVCVFWPCASRVADRASIYHRPYLHYLLRTFATVKTRTTRAAGTFKFQIKEYPVPKAYGTFSEKLPINWAHHRGGNHRLWLHLVWRDWGPPCKTANNML